MTGNMKNKITTPRRLYRFVSADGKRHTQWRSMPPQDSEDYPPRPSEHVRVRLGPRFAMQIKEAKPSAA